MSRERSALQGRGLLRNTAGAVEARAVGLHGFFSAQNGQRFPENLRGPRIARKDDSVVHPFAIATGADDASPPEVGQVARNLGLAPAEDFDEVADADLATVHQVEEPETGGV